MEPNFQMLRKEFPVLERKTYLNSGSYGALANDVKAAFEAYLEDRVLRGANWDAWMAKYESVRALTAKLLHAVPDEIAVTASVSAGLNALASAVERLLAPLSRDARLVTVLDGHPLALSWLGSVRGQRVVPLGIESFGQSGDIPDLYRTYKLDTAAIIDAVARSIA